MEKVNITDKNFSFLIQEQSMIAHVRRSFELWAREFGVDNIKIENGKIIINELGTNLIKFGKSTGEIIVKIIQDDEQPGFEIISVDKGVGIINVERISQDGVSTSGSRGVGIGAMKRLSDVFEIYSSLNSATVIRCVINPKKNQYKVDVGSICVPMTGCFECGDAVWFKSYPTKFTCGIVDGSGHGELGCEASDKAIEILEQQTENQTIPNRMSMLHKGLFHTRGAAVSLFEFNLLNQRAVHCGVGNVNGRIYSATSSTGLIAFGGVVGYRAPRIKEQNETFKPNDMLVYYSDGLRTHTDLSSFHNLTNQSASVIAAFLYKMMTRNNDDASVLVVKYGI